MGHLGLFCMLMIISPALGFGQGFGQQYNYAGQPSKANCATRACKCDQKYIPICATDGLTYINSCQFECARKCNPYLQKKFEGVCAVPYVHNGGSKGGNLGWGSIGSASSNQIIVVTKPPTTRRPNDGFYGSQSQHRPQTPSRYPTSSFNPGTTTRPYSPGSSDYTRRPQPTTRPPPYGSSGYRPTTERYETTRSPYTTESSGYRPGPTQSSYYPESSGGGYQRGPTTQPPYSSGSSDYRPQPTSRPPSYSSGSSDYRPQPTSRPPQYSSAHRPESTTRPSYSSGSSDYRSEPSPYTPGYGSAGSSSGPSAQYQVAPPPSKPTPTQWWEKDAPTAQTRYPPENSENSVIDWRKLREVSGEDDYY